MESSRNRRLVTLVEGAVIAAIAMALSYIPIEAPNAAFDLSLGLIPLAVYAARRGALPAVAVGAVWGLLHLIGGKAYILSIPQFIFEYPFAFAFGGLFGIFGRQIRAGVAKAARATGPDSPQVEEKAQGNVIKWVVLASVVATLSRWFWHFLAGGLVWAEYAPPELNPWVYSLIMNGLSFIGNTVMLIVVMTILVKSAPRLFRV